MITRRRAIDAARQAAGATSGAPPPRKWAVDADTTLLVPTGKQSVVAPTRAADAPQNNMPRRGIADYADAMMLPSRVLLDTISFRRCTARRHHAGRAYLDKPSAYDQPRAPRRHIEC